MFRNLGEFQLAEITLKQSKLNVYNQQFYLIKKGIDLRIRHALAFDSKEFFENAYR